MFINPYEFPDPLGLDRCEHGILLNESCEECLLDVASERIDQGQDVIPAIVEDVKRRDERRRR